MSNYEIIYCNRCGKKITNHRQSDHTDYLHVEKKWGYFSGKDMEMHEWNLCESCYDAFIGTFVIPLQKEEVVEL